MTKIVDKDVNIPPFLQGFHESLHETANFDSLIEMCWKIKHFRKS